MFINTNCINLYLISEYIKFPCASSIRTVAEISVLIIEVNVLLKINASFVVYSLLMKIQHYSRYFYKLSILKKIYVSLIISVLVNTASVSILFEHGLEYIIQSQVQKLPRISRIYSEK